VAKAPKQPTNKNNKAQRNKNFITHPAIRVPSVSAAKLNSSFEPSTAQGYATPHRLNRG
jgi:hypothetical protein